MFSILRNELGYPAHQKPENATGYDINADRVRAQRHSLILSGGVSSEGERQMLEYLIEGVIEVLPENRQRCGRQLRPSDEFLARNKYHQMFLRRARAGQCYCQPFFGCREFSVAEWEVVENPPEMLPGQPPQESFGLMFRDFDFQPMWNRWRPNVPRPADGWSKPGQRPVPEHFRATAEYGWIKVERKTGI
jgi:hypothetical protein